jgi:uncharacterized protein YecE (DUF72 family)
LTIRIGTASWADKSLIATGRFYPPDATTPAARLRHYATQFSLVEADAGFYAIPNPGMTRLWAERTPPGFAMNVKAFRLLTGHQTPHEVLPPEVREALPDRLQAKPVLYYQDLPPALTDAVWRQFREALMPLRHAGRLGLVHFQFPPWLVRNRAGHAHVTHCAERLSGFKLSVEFRHTSWFEGPHAAETLAFERGLGVVHTVVDEPQGFTNTVPPHWAHTDERHALVRMHGRNAATWNNRTSTSGGRFNHDYDDAELEGLAWQIKELDRPGMEVHVVLNNNNWDQAQRNGRTLMGVMAQIGADVVQPPG